MIPQSSFASLSFLTINRWPNTHPMTCDFTKTPRTHFGISLVTEGGCTLAFQGRTLEVQQGEIFFIPVGARYASHWKSPSSNTVILFSFFPDTNFPGNRTIEIQKITPLYDGEFEPLFARAHRDFDTGGSYNFSSLACFFEILHRLLPRLVFTDMPRRDERIERVVDYLEEHYDKSDSIVELAAIAQMSVSHFHATFRAIMGTTPIEYRNTLRIRQAILYLIQSTMTIEAISDALGFESVTYFRRVFKRELGCPPSQYNKADMKV